MILPSSGKRPHSGRIASDPEGIILSKRSRITGTFCPPVSSGVNYRVPVRSFSRKLETVHLLEPMRQTVVGIAKLLDPSHHS